MFVEVVQLLRLSIFHLPTHILAGLTKADRLSVESDYLSCEDKVLNELNFQYLSKINTNSFQPVYLQFVIYLWKQPS